ncbi:Aminopeptidase [Aphelenchoides bicaudatus]|nr:Aminopeptidase [Aphelenchoides bicaudatus]
MLFRVTSTLIFGRRLSRTYQLFGYATMCEAEKFQKLPTFAKPDRYKIHLKPCLKTFECPGHVDINLELTEKTNFVKLHSAVDLHKINVTLENGKEFNNLKFNVDKKWRTVKIDLPLEVEPQKNVTLSIDFKAEISSYLRGFYRSAYKDKNGQEKFLASTQFESDSANYAYPCFDEPIYKSVFDIELEVDETLTALSNMNIIDEKKSADGKKLVKFATTPVMSTYLVAFIVGDFEYIETTYGKKNIPVRIYTLPGKSEQGQFSLEVAKKSMEWYEDWFDYESPLPKVDLIAIPDFSMGAMENWGLVTFREIRLLVDKDTSHRMKALNALVVAHELAHFWFGNLTTMTWWGDLWLKEGFASFMEYFFCQVNYPELKTHIDYLNDVVADGMGEDSLKSSHKIEVDINDPSELTSIYDAITYEKSNSIIRMLFNYLGEETFRAGLRLYVKRIAYKNAVTTDLWQALSDASNQDIGKLMSSWTSQVGYPLVNVEEERLGDGKRRLRLKQTRFLADGSTDNQTWQIPITIIKESDPSKPFHKFLMTDRSQEVVIEVPDNEWIKINSEFSGFYRVQYSDEMLKPLLSAVQTRKLGVLDRFNLSSDLSALVKASKIPASQFFALIAASVNEDECLIWRLLTAGIRVFSNVFGRNDPALKEKLDSFICNTLEPVANNLEKIHIVHLCADLFWALWLTPITSPPIEKALKLFEDFSNGKTLHPDLRSVAFDAYAQTRNNASKKLLELFETNTHNEVQRNILRAAVQIQDEDELKRVFDYAVVDGKVRSQDLYLLFIFTQFGGKTSQDFAYAYFKKNHEKLSQLLGGPTEGVFQHCFEFSACNHSTQDIADDFEVFYNNEFNDEAKCATKKHFEQTKEQILLNKKLFEDHKSSVAEFLAGSH